jgi:hypothetical protein
MTTIPPSELPLRTKTIEQKIKKDVKTFNKSRLRLRTCPPYQLVIEVLRYDKRTGQLFWKKRRGGKALAGVRAGCLTPNGYRVIAIKNKLYTAHKLTWLVVNGCWPGEIDHKNGRRDDNRITNLRECTRSQNLGNKKYYGNPSSRFKGVYFHKGAGRWMARITVNYKEIYLGLFNTQKEGHDAYCAAARKYFGEFARAK